MTCILIVCNIVTAEVWIECEI